MGEVGGGVRGVLYLVGVGCGLARPRGAGGWLVAVCTFVQ